MIEAVEVHETQITKPMTIRLQYPFATGISFGLGLSCAFVLVLLIIAVFFAEYGGLFWYGLLGR